MCACVCVYHITDHTTMTVQLTCSLVWCLEWLMWEYLQVPNAEQHVHATYLPPPPHPLTDDYEYTYS